MISILLDLLPTRGDQLTAPYRVFRGGGWYSTARHTRSAIRNYSTPGYRYYNLGFRLALPPGQ